MPREGSAQRDPSHKGNPCPPGDHRPPTDGAPAVAVTSGRVGAATPSFVTRYRDESYGFGAGSWARFGRDDSVCEIVIWEELLGSSLSRTAGELWCIGGDEMWVRNLSRTHELAVVGPTGPPQVLTPRGDGERGRACSLPGDAVLGAPTTGDWNIVVQRVNRPSSSRSVTDLDAERTWTVGQVPDRLRPVAAALCAPILLRGDPPASYADISVALGVTVRQARRYVDKLSDHYRAQLPDRAQSRDPGHAGYFDLADLLVSRGRVSRDDLGVLDDRADNVLSMDS